MTAKKGEYIRRANRYIKKVQTGKKPASKWERLAVERHVKDLAREGTKEFPYIFDKRKAEMVCAFYEKMKHIKGEWAGKPIVLEDWQCFLECVKFGWVHQKTGLRRFRTSYEEVPRKNGKSTISAARALYMTMADGEGGAEVYSAATTRKQAGIVFNTARLMAKKDRDLLEHFDATVRTSYINARGEECVFEPVSSEAGNLDGLNPHGVSVDELHAHKTREVYDVLETAMGARQQGMLWVITTAGTNINGICYELHNYTEKVLEGVFSDESWFGIIYTIDEDDDPFIEESWRKANPCYGASLKPDYIANLARKAQRTVTAQANFKTKHLDLWVRGDKKWMNLQWWKKNIVDEINIEDFRNCPCWIGLDLASKIDVAALVMLFEKDGEFFIKPRFYLPQDSVQERSEETYSVYESWADAGYFTLTPGEIIDFDYIEDDVVSLNKKLNVRDVAYDPWQATQLAQRLMKQGVSVMEVRQMVVNMSEPMKHVEACVKKGILHHDNNPVMNWMISNVVGHYDNKENIYPKKERQQDKIDGAVSLIMAMARAIFSEDGEESSVYEKRGIVSV